MSSSCTGMDWQVLRACPRQQQGKIHSKTAGLGILHAGELQYLLRQCFSASRILQVLCQTANSELQNFRLFAGMQLSRKVRSLCETSVILSRNVCCFSEWDLVSHIANVFFKNLKCSRKLTVGNSLPKTQPMSSFSVFVTVAKTRKSIK